MTLSKIPRLFAWNQNSIHAPSFDMAKCRPARRSLTFLILSFLSISTPEGVALALLVSSLARSTHAVKSPWEPTRSRVIAVGLHPCPGNSKFKSVWRGTTFSLLATRLGGIWLIESKTRRSHNQYLVRNDRPAALQGA